MLNRITGWLLFLQASYVATFLVLTCIDLATHRSLFSLFRSLRSTLGFEQTLTRLSDYLFYPMVLTAPINVVLLVVFLWNVLRRGTHIDLAANLFNMLNAVYILGSGWAIFAAFSTLLRA